MGLNHQLLKQLIIQLINSYSCKGFTQSPTSKNNNHALTGRESRPLGRIYKTKKQKLLKIETKNFQILTRGGGGQIKVKVK